MADKPEINVIDPLVRDKFGTNSGQYGQFTQELYYLSIYDISKADVLQNDLPLSIGPAAANGGNTSPEYYFRLPPRVLEVSEPFATNITMTQNGGKFVESQGSPIKEVRLSGTTGLRPHRNDKKSLKIFGFDTKVTGPIQNVVEFAGFGNSPDLVGTARSIADVFTKPSPWSKTEALGYDDITFLRNMFRLYAWQKENAENAGNIVMLYRNVKDGDYWLVEPKDFRISQSSQSPLTYEYNIVLSTLMKWDYKVTLKKDPMQVLRDARNFYARVNQLTAVIKQSFLYIASKIDRFSRLPQNISDFILGPMISVIQGASAVKKSSKRFSDVFSSNLRQLKDNLNTYIPLCVAGFPVQAEEINVLRKALIASTMLLSDPNNNTSISNTAADSKASILASYNTTSTGGVSSSITAGFSGSSAFVGNQSLGNDVAKAIVNVGDDIRSLSYRLLGDRTKYHILIILNDLQAPYVSSVGSHGVLKPGDTILYPKVSSVPNALSSITKQNTTTTSGQSQTLDHQYGVDLRLNSTVDGVLGDVSDIYVNQTGDLDIISGIENISQAVKIKFSVKRGELPAHLFFGALFPMGTKATPTSLAGFRAGVEQTLLSDLRVDGIKSLKFVAVSDSIAVSASVFLKNLSSSLKLDFPVRTL
jgi:hypothetical protein